MKKIKTIFAFTIVIIISMAIGIWLGFNTTLKFMEGNGIFHQLKGSEYFDKGDKVRAMASYNRAIGLSPVDSSSHIGLADTYYSIGRFDLALEEYDAALELHLDEAQDNERWMMDELEGKITKTKEMLSKDNDKQTDSSQVGWAVPTNNDER